MKKSIKIISLLMMIAIMVMVATQSFAAINDGSVINNVEAQANNATDVAVGASKLAGTILKYAQWVAVSASVIVITILGIKYMMGSLEEKSAYKKSMVPLVVGAIVAIAATTIARILFSIF